MSRINGAERRAMTHQEWLEAQRHFDTAIEVAETHLVDLLFTPSQDSALLTDEQREHIATAYSLLFDIDNIRLSLAVDRMQLVRS